MKHLDKKFNKIREDVKDFDKQVEIGNLFIPRDLPSELNCKERIYISAYYCYGKDLARTHKEMRKTLKSTTAWRVRKKLVEKGYLPKC